MKGYLFSFLIISFTLFKLQAQEHLQGDYIFTSLGLSQDRFSDAFVSPNHYDGWSGQIGLGWHSLDGPWMSNLDLFGHGGWQSPASYPEQSNQVLGLGFRGHYSLRYKFWERRAHQLLGGLYSQNIFILREHNLYQNSAQSFSGFFGYGPSLAYTYSHKNTVFSKDWHWSWQSELNLPLGSYVIRPHYVRQYAAGELANRGHHFLGGTWQIDLRHSLIWHRRNGNQIRLMYAWEYFQSTALNPLYQGGHQLHLQLFYKLWERPWHL